MKNTLFSRLILLMAVLFSSCSITHNYHNENNHKSDFTSHNEEVHHGESMLDNKTINELPLDIPHGKEGHHHEEVTIKDVEQVFAEKGEEIRTINISANRFIFSPKEIRIKAGEKVKLVVDNIDFEHNIIIPALGIASTNEAIIQPDKIGRYTFFCANFLCGEGHHDMEGFIVVEE